MSLKPSYGSRPHTPTDNHFISTGQNLRQRCSLHKKRAVTVASEIMGCELPMSETAVTLEVRRTEREERVPKAGMRQINLSSAS